MSIFVDKGNRRSKLQVSMDIIEMCRREHKPTRIMYATGTSWNSLKEYLAELEEKGIVEQRQPEPINRNSRSTRTDKRTRTTWHTTEKGIELLKKFQELNMLEYDLNQSS